MKKSYIQDCINKYYLGGACESVVWDVKDKEISIDFANDIKDTVGNITFKLVVPQDAREGSAIDSRSWSRLLLLAIR